jgi:thiamine biosynthesis lipoprotein
MPSAAARCKWLKRILLSSSIAMLLCAILTLAFISMPYGRCGEPIRRFEFAQLHMGVKVRIVVYADSMERAEDGCRAAFKRIAELEDIFSDYRQRSEVMRLCACSGGHPVKVSDELFCVLELAQKLAELTDGAFDVTVGPLTHLWRNARAKGRLPSQEEVKDALKKVGWKKMRLDATSRTVQLLESGMLLDLGGIAKGFIIDCAIDVLKRKGLCSALIEAGGDIVVGDPPPNSEGWKIALPYATSGVDGCDGKIVLANAAVSTSGDVEQFFEFGGSRYSHIVDPRSGFIEAKGVVATVVAPNGTIADPLATILYMLGDMERFRHIVVKLLGERSQHVKAFLFRVR